MASTQPFTGLQRRLVLAFDVGTTYSGVSYAFLEPGEAPQILGVTRFPGQENIAGDSKIPTIIYYNVDGTVRASGAEAALPSMLLEAEDNELIFVEWFKLHLRPDSLDTADMNKQRLPALPLNKTVIDVFGDFMAYLLSCTKRYIIETHANGSQLWDSVSNRIEFVLTHPNGWEGAQQGKMRQAAVLGGLIPDDPEDHARIHFVTEGEASLHFCVNSGLVTDVIQNGESVMIVDAGGGTIDLSTYRFTTVTPISVEEVASSDCILQGSTQVNVRAATFLQAKLKNSKYGNEEDIKTMLERFDKSTKPIFKDKLERSFIKFGSMRDKDPSIGIRSGQLILEGSDVASFFAPCIEGIVNAIKKQRQTASVSVFIILLVGGFAASSWLYSQLDDIVQQLGMKLCRPDGHTSKAVAEGAVSFYLDRLVSVRVPRFTYGVRCVTEYNPDDQEHIIRYKTAISRPSGRCCVIDAYETLLPKGTPIRENHEVSRSFYQESKKPSTLNNISSQITCYRGKLPNPHWIDEDPNMYSTLCTVHANTSQVQKVKKYGTQGKYYTQDYKILLLCGLTEMKAQISWIRNGVEQRGPATIVYDDDAVTA